MIDMHAMHACSGAGPRIFVFRERRPYRLIRRMTDLVFAPVFLALAAPIVIVAITAILLEDGRPIFHTQRRVGRFGHAFTIFKLRTMRNDLCGDLPSPTSSGDSRVTRIGRILRRLSIDEIPQFVNVIRGDMSLVGPRPELPFRLEQFERWQHLKFLAPPGITGLWQTTTHRRMVPNHSPEATAIDLAYVERASVLLDFRLLVNTARAVVFAKGAY
jgi:lipopolysaccharide/colanic/teichoic acid biosynthesis glycosyltransferase